MKSSAAAKKAPAKKAPAKKAPAKKSARKAPAKKAPAPARPPAPETPAVSRTVITALVNIGFGNSLYLRGDAPGLSWNYGVPMDCKTADAWSLAMVGVNEPFEFKLLLNDENWCQGDNYVAQPGAVNEVVPRFS